MNHFQADVPWTITQAALDDIEAHAREERPRECCGVLLGVGAPVQPVEAVEAGGRVMEARRAPNLSDNANRYELDPKVHVQLLREARARALDVVGFYHSHPHSPATPSPTDVAESAYQDLLHVIVSLEQLDADIRAFRLGGGSYAEVALTRVMKATTRTG